MAEDLDVDTCLGFKRRISELSETEDTQHTVEEQRSDSLSLQEQSFEFVSAVEDERETARKSSGFASEPLNSLLKKAKCSSSDESETNIIVQEKQETIGCELGFGNDVLVKPKGGGDEDSGVVGMSNSLLRSEKDKDLKTCEVEFSGIREFGELEESSSSRFSVKEVQIESVVEDCSTGFVCVDSFIAFGDSECQTFFKNKENQCLVEPEVESVSDSKTHVVEFTHTDNSTEILGDDTIKIKELLLQTSKIGAKLGVMESIGIDETKSGSEGMQEILQSDDMERDGGDRKCALKIEVIDETALIETVFDSEVGNDHGREKGFMGFAKYSGRNDNKKNMTQEMDGKKEKRSRRRGKGAKKCLGTNAKEHVLTHMSKDPNSRETTGDEAKRVYSRKVIEALRFVNAEEQRKKWIEVYCGLGPAVTREYDGLVDRNHEKLFCVNFDPRQQFRKEASPILSAVVAKGRGNHLKIFVN